jgi:MYXO-CTERM domain-containing protein
VVDLFSNVIRRVSGSGVETAVAGNGTAGFSGDGGPAARAKLNVPRGVAVDAAGNLLIADSENDRVRLVAAKSCSSSCPYGLALTTAGDIYTVAGDGRQGYSGDGGPATSAELYDPTGVAVDADGDLLIADWGNSRIRLMAAKSCTSGCPFGLPGTTAGDIYTVAGAFTAGNSGDGGPAASAELAFPHSVSFDSAGDLLIVDTANNGVRLVAAKSCSSSCPYGLASTTAGDIYTVAGSGTAGYSGDGGPAASAELNLPHGAAVDASGDLLIADSDNERIRLVAAKSCSSSCPFGLRSTTAGDIYTVAGDGTRGYSGGGGAASSADLDFPAGVAVSAAGDLLIADDFNSRVRMMAAKSCTSSCPYGLASTTAGDIYTVAGDGGVRYSGGGTPPGLIVATVAGAGLVALMALVALRRRRSRRGLEHQHRR